MHGYFVMGITKLAGAKFSRTQKWNKTLQVAPRPLHWFKILPPVSTLATKLHHLHCHIWLDCTIGKDLLLLWMWTTCHSREETSRIRDISWQAVSERHCWGSPWTDRSVVPDFYFDHHWDLDWCWLAGRLDNWKNKRMAMTSGLVLALADHGSQLKMLPVLRTACSGRNRDWNLKYN